MNNNKFYIGASNMLQYSCNGAGTFIAVQDIKANVEVEVQLHTPITNSNRLSRTQYTLSWRPTLRTEPFK
jgi:hypothetical protein